jgi:hypothetical protein
LETTAYGLLPHPGVDDANSLRQVFWMTYDDLLKKYQQFDRTRLFGPEWIVNQQWTSFNVSWSADYHSTKFVIQLMKRSQVVIVFSQASCRPDFEVIPLPYIALILFSLMLATSRG